MDVYHGNNSKKAPIISGSNVNVSLSSSWFNILKRSLATWKSAAKFKALTCENNSSNNVKDKEHPNDYFTDEFLDSFNSKPGSRQFSKFSFTSRFKINRHQVPLTSQRSTNSPPKTLILDEFNKESTSIDIILPCVVEAYINETCTEMLQSKMKSVCQRLQIWNKNVLTKPGFKPVHLNVGGNITKTEKLFVPQKTAMLPKNESFTLNFDCQRKDIVSRRIMKVTENIEKSSNLNNRVSENVNLLKSTRGRLSFNRFFETKKQNNKSLGSTKTEICSIKNSKTKSDVHKRNSSQEFNSNTCAVKLSQNKSENPIKCIEPSKATDDTKSQKLVSLTNSSLKWNKETLLKCAKELKIPLKMQLDDEKVGHEKRIHKSLNISKIVNIDISPSTDYTKQITPPISDKEIDGKIIEDCVNDEPENFEIDNSKANQIRIRRCVTFLEPKNCSLNISLRKEGFCSEIDVRMSRNEPDFYKAKSEEFPDCISSSTLTPVQHDTVSGGFNPQFSSSLYKTHISDFQDELLKDGFDLDIEENFILAGDNQTDDLVPVLVSLHSAPSSSDENTENDDEVLQENSGGILTNDFGNGDVINDTRQSQDDKKVILDTNSACYGSEATAKVPSRGAQNYSIIEIVNKIKSRGDEGIFHCKKLIERCSEKNRISRIKSANSLLKSSMDDTDIMLNTEKLESQILTYPTIVQQEILVSEEDFNLQVKPISSVLSQMKIANFSSSSLREESGLNSTLRHTSSSYLFIPYNFMKDDCLGGNNIQLIPVPVEIGDDTNTMPFTNKTITNTHTHSLLEHTVSSKQKCRFKAPYVANRLRNPMKFSKSISKL